MRKATNLLNRSLNQRTRLRERFPFAARLIVQMDGINNHFRRAQFLSQTIVQFTREAPAFLVLHREEASRKITQLAIQNFKLPGFAMQVSEDSNFGAKQFGNDRNGDVIYRSALIAF